MQTDPIGYKDDLDLYTYVGDDPMNKTDPDGKIPVVVLIPFALKAIDAAMTAAEVYSAAQTGGASAVAGVLLPNLAGNIIPGGKVIAKIADKAHDAVGAGKAADKAAEGAAKAVVEKTASGGRVGDFTRTQKREAKAENAAANGGEMRCKDCSKPLENVKSEKGVPTPGNQAQVHHDPAIQHGGGQHSTPVVVCPDCHKKRHFND